MSVALLVRAFFWLWFASAVAVGHWQVLQRLAPVAIALVPVALGGALLIPYFRISALRAWIDAIDVRALVLVHVSRLIGVYLLVLQQQGALPRAFAIPAGIGDIVVAVMALPIVFAPLDEVLRRRALRIWSVVGLIDTLLVIATVARLNLRQPEELRLLTELPLSFLPTLLLPEIIATHVIILHRSLEPQSPA